MRAVVQRVSRARVTVNGEVTGKIACGLLVLLGVAHTDTESDADYLADKIAGLRIFEDEAGKLNLAARTSKRASSSSPSSHSTATSAGASVHPSTPLPHRNTLASSTNILWSASAARAWCAKPAASRR